ncbi:endonuclease domain-containing protein [Rhodohalobacter barkolensis]|uniref:DNA methylase n=1 Tax=Rhodohalobacter barkolensis TaxID=2053187 RepID=A0A2N0VI25_9BACT|nr:endonuclease domain-containing protein [Rhodohalobacter barkolensis]PKD43788.1 DNA methylase [Rhodohalobacter barkolensis]
MNSSNYYYNKNLKEFARKLRKQSTKAEIKLWNEVLRSKQMHGFTFLRQRPVDSFIADFMCKKLMLIIEVDGYSHEFEEKWILDQERQQKLEGLGFTILRFTDEEVLKDIQNVERVIEGWILDHPPVPLQRGNVNHKS